MRTITKSTTCFGGRGPLTVYYSASHARESALYQKEQRGLDLEAYKCQECGRWHLSPPRACKQNSCGCTDRHGKPKTLYSSEDAAENAKAATYRRKGTHVFVYPCPHGAGWHLTGRGSK